MSSVGINGLRTEKFVSWTNTLLLSAFHGISREYRQPYPLTTKDKNTEWNVFYSILLFLYLERLIYYDDSLFRTKYYTGNNYKK